MRKTLNEILNDFNTHTLNKVAEEPVPADAVAQEQAAAANAASAAPVPSPEQAQPEQPAPVPVGSPEEAQAMAEQEAEMQAQAAANAANAEVAAQKAKEDAVTNAAGALVAAEQQKQQAMDTLSQVASEAISTENAAIAKEAADFGALAGESMAESFYNRMYLNNTLNDIYTKGYEAVDSLVKSANVATEIETETDAYNMHRDNAYNEVDGYVFRANLQKLADEMYEETNKYLMNASMQVLAEDAYVKVTKLHQAGIER